MSLPAFGDRKRIEIICLGFLIGILPFSGCAFNRTADDRFPAWSRTLARRATIHPRSATVRTLPSGPAISRRRGSIGRDDAPPATAVATDSGLANRHGEFCGFAQPYGVHPYIPCDGRHGIGIARESLRPRDLRIGHWKLHELSVVRKNPATRTVLHVNEDTFEQHVLRSNVPVLVDFYASWCGPCKKLAPTLEQVAAESPQAKVVKVDIDNNPKLAAQYGIKSLPSLLVFKDGRVVAKQQGVVAKSRLKAMLAL